MVVVVGLTERHRRCSEASLIGVNERSVPNKVDLAGGDEFGLVEDLPENEQDGSEDEHSVVGEERLDREASLEGTVAINEYNGGLEGQCDVGAVRLEVSGVRESLAVQTLRLASPEEADVRDAHDDVVDKTTGSDDVCEPRENLGGRVRQVKERQEREDHDDGEAVDRNTVLRAFPQELGGTTLDGERVQTTGSTVRVCVSSREDTGDQKGVDQMGKTVDVEVLHGNDIGRCGSRALASSEDGN